MLEGDFEISTVTILQSLIDKINITLNDCEGSLITKSSSSSIDYEIAHNFHGNIVSNLSKTSGQYSEESLNSNSHVSSIIDSNQYKDIEVCASGSITQINGSPAAFVEVCDAANASNDGLAVNHSSYDTLAQYIRDTNKDNEGIFVSEEFSPARLELSDISTPEENQDSGCSCKISSECNENVPFTQHTQPFTKTQGSPFHLFSAKHLDEATEFSHNFSKSNRSAAYYGKYPYSYGKVSHAPKDFSENVYLQKILSYIEIVLPSIKYNSAMIHKYNNGTAYIPHHADNEEEIEDGSQIVTISFGGSRFIEFQNTENGSKICHKLFHGDVFTMEKSTQGLFTHSVPQNVVSPCEMRLSVTLRLISPPKSKPTPSPYSPLSSSLGLSVSLASSLLEPAILQNNSAQEVIPTLEKNLQTSVSENSSDTPPVNNHDDLEYVNSSSSSKTLYISDSMFRKLDESRLSSESQTAIKLFYPGANASQMLCKLTEDQTFDSIEKSSIKRVFILTGSNNIDDIYFDRNGGSLDQACSDIKDLIKFLNLTLPEATINVLNILPRKLKGRCDIINIINSNIESLCNSIGNLRFIDTFFNKMFSHRDGSRKEYYFNQFGRFGTDDVHLNAVGVVRLAKYLKYLAHNT